MIDVPAKSIEALLEDIRLLGAEQHLIVQAVREQLKQQISPLTEEVKYGGLMYSSTRSFCGIFAYQQHVSVEFTNGTKIADPLGHLEGSGKFRRHIKLHSVADIEHKAVARYLPLALQAAGS